MFAIIAYATIAAAAAIAALAVWGLVIASEPQETVVKARDGSVGDYCKHGCAPFL